MSPYNVKGWVFAGTGTVTTLLPVVITDDDPLMSPYFNNDFTETVTIAGTTYTNPRGGTYRLTFTDSGGVIHTENFLLWWTGAINIFVPLPGSDFDTGSVVNSLGGWQQWTTGFNWSDVTCFLAGTLIETSKGPQSVEHIKVGDLVRTPDGFSAVKWVGCRQVCSKELAQAPRLRPVRIMAGALGNNLPKRDLIVSRQHRMLLRSKIADRMFGETEVLVSAIKLTELPGIYVADDIERVAYYHLLFEQHEIIFAEGAPSESLFTGPQALKSLTPEAREELETLFPELAQLDYTPKPARFIPPGKLQKQLVARHLKNKIQQR